ncbi:MAG: hypothetical protein ABI619_09535, partial [Betaproteobacteria bacterium]
MLQRNSLRNLEAKMMTSNIGSVLRAKLDFRSLARSPQANAVDTGKQSLLTRVFKCSALALVLATGSAAATAATGSNKFIPTFLVYYGGGPTLGSADVPKLAKYDLLDIDRFRYNNIGSNTWAAIKAVNPNVQIFLYEMGPEAPSHLDSTQQVYLNGLGRHNVSRGHP